MLDIGTHSLPCVGSYPRAVGRAETELGWRGDYAGLETKGNSVQADTHLDTLRLPITSSGEV